MLQRDRRGVKREPSSWETFWTWQVMIENRDRGRERLVCRLTPGEIAKLVGLPRWRVKEAIAELVSLGWVTRAAGSGWTANGRWRQRPNVYRLHMTPRRRPS